MPAPSNSLARALGRMAETARADASERQRASWAPLSVLFPKQQDAFNDNARWRAVICSRRAGKSRLAILELLRAALARPDSFCVYIGLTRDAAYEDIWRDLVKYVKEYALGGKIDLTSLAITFPNGSRIRLRGLSDRSECEWFRGKRYDLVIVDEMQSQGAYVRELLDDVIGPALLDRGGRVLLLGTPGWVEAGFWHEVAAEQSLGYSVHSWTLADNPHLPDVGAFLADMAKRLGGEHSPKFQREYLGRWVRDPSGLVFRFDPKVNYYDALPGPMFEAESVIGVDTGSVDADAVNVWSWWPRISPDLWQTAEIVETKQSVDKLIAQVMSLVETYRPHAVVIDPAYGGRKIGDTIMERYGVHVESAEKDRKAEFCEFFDTDLQAGRLRCMRARRGTDGKQIGGRLADDLCVISWDKKSLEQGERKIAKVPHSDIVDAALYAHRKAKHFWHKPAPPPKTDEQLQRERLRAELLAREAERMAAPFERSGDPRSLYR